MQLCPQHHLGPSRREGKQASEGRDRPDGGQAGKAGRHRTWGKVPDGNCKEQDDEIRAFSGDPDGHTEVTQGRASECEHKLEFTQLERKKTGKKEKRVEPQGWWAGVGPVGVGGDRVSSMRWAEEI